MNVGFESVRRSAAASRLGRLATRGVQSVGAAWRSSLIGRTVDAEHAAWAALSPADRIRWAGRAVAVAAVAHLALRFMMSSTVAPALPTLLVAGVAVFGALAAWQAAAFARAWRER